MGDPKSTLVFSIDPGIVNIGACCYDYATGEVLFAERLTLAPSLKALKSDSEITPRVFKLFFDDTNSPYKKMINSSCMVLIENQMKARMKIIQHVIGSLCFAANIEYKMVAPQSIKAHFNTGSYARKKAGTTVKGKKNNHRENKKMGIAKAEQLHPKLFAKCSQAKKDDIADALLQAVWYGDKQTGKKRKHLSDTPIIEKPARKKRRKKTA